MGNIKYRLRATSDKKISLIHLVYWHDGNRFFYPTGQKIENIYWNDKEQRAVKRKGNTALSSLNTLLDKIEQRVKTAERKLLAEGKPTSNTNLKEYIDKLSGKSIKKIEYTSLVKYGFDVVERYKKMGKYPKAINSTTKMVEKFRRNTTFEDVDVNFHDDLVTYMKVEGYAKNYIGKVVGTIKLLMNLAVEEGITKSVKYKSSRFKRVQEPVYNIYLSIEELETIHKHNYKLQRLDNAADLFLIGAFTGLRFSDYAKMEGVNFDDGEFIVQDTMKVDSRLVIPQHRIIKEILAKRDGELPYPISNVKLNLYLKDVGKEAGINQEVIKTITKGMGKVRTTYKKYELITTHTARRSLATNMYLVGIPIKTIMSITGHSTVAQLMSYIKITEVEVAESIKDHPFFK
jgi:integrase